MRIALFAFAYAAVAAALPLQESQKVENRTADPQLEKIPINLGASLRRPNGDVIGILKARQSKEGLGQLGLDTADEVTLVQKRQNNGVDELTVNEVQETAGRVIADKPVTVGVPMA